MRLSTLLFIFCLSGTLFSCQSPKQEHNVIRIGMASDVHLPTMHDAAYRFQKFIDSMEIAQPDFIIELGDLVTPAPRYDSLFEIWRTYSGPKYHVIGNHEMDGGYSLEEAIAFRNMASSYYSFHQNGFDFIVLDGNDKKHPDQKGYREYIGPPQQEWLRRELEQKENPVVIFSHQAIGKNGGMDNAEEIRKILESHNAQKPEARVIACFNGHLHYDDAEHINGIWYIHINSMAYFWMGEEYAHIRYSEEVDRDFRWIKYTAPYKEPLYTVVEISTEGYIYIAGKYTEYVGPSPWDLGYPEKHKNYVKPQISERLLKF